MKQLERIAAANGSKVDQYMLRSPYIKDIYEQDAARRSHQIEGDGYLKSAAKKERDLSGEKAGSALPALQPSSSLIDMHDQDANYKNPKILATGRKMRDGRVIPNKTSDVLSAARREKDYPGKQLKLKANNKSPSVTSRIKKPIKVRDDYESFIETQETDKGRRNRRNESPQFGQPHRSGALADRK